MEEKNIIEDISNESDIFETDVNAPDCCELAALFFVYKFLFMGEYDGMCNVFEDFKK